MDVMSIQPLVHSLHLWYYPPHVTDVCTDFELAARGYTECLDTLIPMKGFKCMLDKQDNQRADEGMSIFFNPFWPSLMRFLQMATGLRKWSPLWHKCLAHQIAESCNDFMVEGLHLLDTQNGKVFGTKQWTMSALSISRRDNLPTTSHFPPFTSSGVPLNRIRGHITTTFSFCGMCHRSKGQWLEVSNLKYVCGT